MESYQDDSNYLLLLTALEFLLNIENVKFCFRDIERC